MFRRCGIVFLIALCWVVLLSTQEATAENWPSWRGPGGQGHTQEKNLPLKWNRTENIKWKVKLAEVGNSTPIVWESKIFLTQATKGGKIRSLLCLDRANGNMLWQHDVSYDKLETAWNPTYYASASPTTDGTRVVASFGSAGLYCYDMTGKELWKRTDLGHWTHQFGNASSPVLYKDLVLFWCGPDKQRNSLLAVNKTTGATVWEHKEAAGGSWATPVIVSIKGQDQLLLGVPYKLKGFDPSNGKELWHCDGLNQLIYTSVLYSNNVAVAMSGYNKDALAVQIGGTGDITPSRLWHHPKNIQRVGSGAIVGDHVYILEENGLPRCYELRTGKEVWQVQKPLKGKTWSSLVVSGDRLYALCQNGDTHVFAASPKYQLLATNSLDEATNASIAVSNGELFLRTSNHLWCIRETGK